MINVLILSTGAVSGFWQRAVHEVFYAACFGDIGHELAFLFFLDILEFLQFMRKVVGDSEESVRALQSFVEGRSIGDIALLEVDIGPEFEEVLSSGFAGIAGQCTNLLTLTYKLDGERRGLHSRCLRKL